MFLFSSLLGTAPWATMKTPVIYRASRINREETLHVNEHGRLILCMDWWQHSNDKLGMGITRLLGTLNHLNCAIHIMPNLVSITERANLMTSGGLKEEGQRHKELTLNYLAHTGSILKQLEVAMD